MEQSTLTHLVALGTISKLQNIRKFLRSKTDDCKGCRQVWCPTCHADDIVRKCEEATTDQHTVKCILEHDPEPEPYQKKLGRALDKYPELGMNVFISEATIDSILEEEG